MISSLRRKFSSFRGKKHVPGGDSMHGKPNRHEYSRPAFLNLTEEKSQAAEDHDTRPVIGPNNPNILPWTAGYAECVGTRLKPNEDQTAFGEIKLDHQLTPEQFAEHNKADADQKVCQVTEASLRGFYFGVFDGHGGSGAALMVADQMINHLQEKLVEVRKDLFDLALREERSPEEEPSTDSQTNSLSMVDIKLRKEVSIDDLIIGALESAFHAMDDHIGREKASFNITGGCCSLVALFLLGKVYIANIGDSRAVAYIDSGVIPLSTDFTADEDAERIYSLAKSHPELIRGQNGEEFSIHRFNRHVGRDDIGKRLLCKRPNHVGWSYKEVTADDVKFPLITGAHRGSRLMNCIGISRSIGDHDLTDEYSGVKIKPFLSCLPEVKILDLRITDIKDTDVLVIGSDGLWDGITCETMGEMVRAVMNKESGDLKYGKTAYQIVEQSRGTKKSEFGGWRTMDGEEASYDDITALIIPLHHAANFTHLTMSLKSHV